MAAAGWYPDPSGAPGFRYWDGGSWSSATSTSPHAPAPGAAPSAPPPSSAPPTWAPGGAQGQGGYAGGWNAGQGGQGGYAGGWNAGPGPASAPPPGRTPGRAGRRRTVLLAVGAVVVVLALVAGSLLVVRGLTGDDEPTDEAVRSQGAGPTDPTEDPTEDPTDDPTEGDGGNGGGSDGGASVQCMLGQPTIDGNQRRGGELVGGGLSMPAVEGYAEDDTAGAQFTFADGVVASVLVIEQNETAGWVSEYALGGLNRDNEFASPEAAARTVLDCMENSNFYENITGSTEVDAVTTTVDGAEAFVLTQEIRVDEPELTVEGDIAQVAVVDTGDEATYGLFVSVVPIGAQPLLQQAAAQLMALRVE